MRACEQTAAMLRWWESARIDQADLAIRRPDGTVAWHRDRHLSALPLSWARAENVRRADVYIRPARDSAWPLVFLDDVPVPLATSIARKYPALVIRTSPVGGCHVWLRCSIPLPEDARGQAQRWLACRIGADRGSVSGEHLGRLAGFRNWKRHGVWVNLLVASDQPSPWNPQCALGDMLPDGVGLVRSRRPNSISATDTSPSGQEWGWVCGMLESGMDPETIRIKLAASARPRRRLDAARYARYTVARALRRRYAPPGPTREPRES